MRANSPTDNDLAVTQLLAEEEESAKLTSEQQALAKVGASDGWALLKTYLEKRIETYKTGLFGESLANADAATIGNRFLAAQSVVREFEALIKEVETTTQAVIDATSEPEKPQQPVQ